jgi:uridine kinase
MPPYLIGIAGPSCSGKTEVARRLSRILRAPIVALDHYYKDLRHLPFEERARVNFDSPEALDHELIVAQAQALKHGDAIEKPTYDFTQHLRAPATERIESAAYVILEGLFALYWEEVRNLLNLGIYITASHEVCLARRIFRDVRERGRTEESVRQQYRETVQPMCEAYVAPTSQYARIVLSGTDPVKQSVRTILDAIP